ncbi:MAG TPA: DUF3488 and transglutaminase-like domain-containing protein [Candidatus Rifleibacterium sp.]|nr:DUF3488 and transglutaminase-like domain-containing protein [Candidatus Rifleibacterium sp.]HPT45944.1 DUF3488 and transglutaminase-like domain-containing protein [Candidatus Rifleibacterium sp.]
MSITVDLQKSDILGSSRASLFGAAKEVPVDRFVFRLIVSLALCAFLGIYTTGFLRPLLTVISLPLLFFFFYGRAINSPRANFVGQLISLASLIYIFLQRSGPLPGIVLLLQFTSIVLFIQIVFLRSLRALNGALILSLMIILAVAAMNVNFLFPVILTPYVMNFFLILRWISLFRHQAVAGGRVKIDLATKALKGQLVGFFVSATAFLVLCLVLFYLIPRTESLGLASEASKRRLTGFSDTLSLGETGVLEDNPAVVMRIRPIEEKTMSPSIVRRLKSRQLRGTTFARYRSGKWEKGRKRRWFADLRRNSGEVQLIESGFSQRDVHPFEIILENTEPPLIFVPDQTAFLAMGLTHIGVEDDRSLYFVNRVSGSRRYVASLVLNPLEVTDSLVEAIVPGRDTLQFMDVSGIPERVTNLAAVLASGTSTIAQRIDKAMSFLSRQCIYSLEQPVTGERDPVDFFLFENKAGSCEHFASALALILRAMQIPARPVSGYTMGDWNDVGKFFTVRQGHAHTWVEVFFPQSGWVPFDPTPAQVEREIESEVEKFFVTLWETFEGYWFSYVFSFDNRSQIQGFRKIFVAMNERFDFFVSALFHKEYFIVLLLLVVFFGRKLRFIFRKLVRSSNWIPLFYLEWEARLPVDRKPFETPAEFHQRLFAAGIVNEHDFSVLKQVSSLINEAVFNAGSDSRKSFSQAEALLRSIRSK